MAEAPPAAPAAPQASPEDEVKARVKALQTQAEALENEIKTMRGRISNRDPEALKDLQKENEELKARSLRLQKILSGILVENLRPSQISDEKVRHEILRQAAISYFRKANIDPEIWKSIAS